MVRTLSLVVPFFAYLVHRATAVGITPMVMVVADMAADMAAGGEEGTTTK